MAYRFDASDLQGGIEKLANRAEMEVRMYADTGKQKLEDQARKDAPWTDRTGDARKRLNSYTEPRPNAVRIYLAHGVDYGVWLELAMQKRYAIIAPTISHMSQEIFNGLDRLLDRMG